MPITNIEFVETTLKSEVRLSDTKFLMLPSSYYTYQWVVITHEATKMDAHRYIFKSSPSKTESCINSAQQNK